VTLKKLLADIDRALKMANDDVNSHDGSKYARGLAGEGYAGGYAQALRDVRLAAQGVKPQTRHYWDRHDAAT
jgi:hypothetical protein